GNKTNDPLIRADGSLVLEGLELQRFDDRNQPHGTTPVHIVHTTGKSLRVANCRFRARLPDRNMPHQQSCIWADTAGGICAVRNCEFLTPAEISLEASFHTLILDNCSHVGRLVANIAYSGPEREGVEVRLTRNTVVCRDAQMIHACLAYDPEKLKSATNP